jgi:hypothetical protein
MRIPRRSRPSPCHQKPRRKDGGDWPRRRLIPGVEGCEPRCLMAYLVALNPQVLSEGAHTIPYGTTSLGISVESNTNPHFSPLASAVLSDTEGTTGGPLQLEVEPGPGEAIGALCEVSLEGIVNAAAGGTSTNSTSISGFCTVGEKEFPLVSFSMSGGFYVYNDVTDPNDHFGTDLYVPIGAAFSLSITDYCASTTNHYTIPYASAGVNIEAYVTVIGAVITPQALSYNTKDGGVDFTYAITGGDLPDAATIALYWAPSSSFDPSSDTPIASTTDSIEGSHDYHVAPAQIPNPPDQTDSLLAVINPDAPATMQVLDLAYDPTITYVSSKYDGKLSNGEIGRFLADPPTGAPPITDETITVQLSDSLAALRPDVVVGTNTSSPNATDGWDGATYVTEGFDPGTLSDGAVLPMVAERNGQVLEDDNSPAFDVKPLPGWYDQLEEPTISFDATAGAYTIKGALAQLGSSNLLTIQPDTPIVGGKTIGATLGYGIIVTAPLSEASATVNSYAALDVNLLGLASIHKDFSTDVNLSNQSSFSITPQGTLDPATLEMINGFGVTLKLSDTETLANVTFLDQVLYPSFFVVETGIKGSLKETLTEQAQITYVDGSFQFAPGGGTYIQDTMSAALTGYANAGWFIPAKYSRAFTAFLQLRLPNYFPSGFLLPQLSLNNELTGSLDLTGKVVYNGNPNAPLANLDVTAGGTINVQVKQTLVFMLGNVNLLGVLPPITYQLFPSVLPFKFKLFGP